MAKHDELSSGIIYLMCFHQFKLLSIYKPRNLVINTLTVLSYLIFKLIHVLLLVANFMKFVLSKFNVSILALNHLFRSAKTSVLEL
jgi:hypothetical protein